MAFRPPFNQARKASWDTEQILLEEETLFIRPDYGGNNSVAIIAGTFSRNGRNHSPTQAAAIANFKPEQKVFIPFPGGRGAFVQLVIMLRQAPVI